MVKTIIKETCIILLLIVAILLVLGIVFYEYIPITKVVPEKVSYTIPESVRNELTSENKIEEITTQTTVYEITTSDLQQYEYLGIYDKGKSNPFAMPSQSNTNSIDDNGIISCNNSNNSNQNTEEHLFNTVGK